jgi:CubicO group peptidase (beta-lactamase class C family)
MLPLSHVVETLTGKWLGDVLSERVWKPLGMTGTYSSLAQAKAAVDNGEAELARGYLWNNLKGEYSPVEWLDSLAVSGAGAMISNVLDYTKWLRFLIDKGDLLSKEEH